MKNGDRVRWSVPRRKGGSVVHEGVIVCANFSRGTGNLERYVKRGGFLGDFLDDESREMFLANSKYKGRLRFGLLELANDGSNRSILVRVDGPKVSRYYCPRPSTLEVVS